MLGEERVWNVMEICCMIRQLVSTTTTDDYLQQEKHNSLYSEQIGKSPTVQTRERSGDGIRIDQKKKFFLPARVTWFEAAEDVDRGVTEIFLIRETEMEILCISLKPPFALSN